MRIKKVFLYKFDELSDSAKKNAIEQMRDMYVDGCNWYEDVYDNFTEYIENTYGVKIFSRDMNFTGFWSQGDGASFVCEFTDDELSSLIDKLKIGIKHNLKKLFIDCIYDVKIERYGCLEYNEYSVYVTGYMTDSLEKYRHLDHYLSKKFDKFLDKLENWKNEMCGKLYNDLENEYNFLTSDEFIAELLSNSDYEFTQDGKLYS